MIEGENGFMGRFGGRKRKNGTGSILMTCIIYGLMGYLIFSFVKVGLGKFMSQDTLASIIKKTAQSNVLAIDYISEQDKKLMSASSGTTNFILKLISDPITDYANEKIPVNVAGDSEIRFFLDNAHMSDSTSEAADDENAENSSAEGKDSDTEDDKDASGNHDDTNGSSNDGSNGSLNENADGNSENGESSENQTQQTNIGGFNQVQDIKTEELTYDYLMKNFYTVVSSTTLNPEDIDANKLMNMDLKISTTSDKPQILIYHTHGQEGFTDSVQGDPNTGIIGVGNYLTEILTKQYGYNVLHITDSFDYVNGVFDRSKAYDYACDRIAQILAENPSIEVVIDLHRDGVNENLHLVTEVNGKPTAKIMFFNGISRLNSIGEIGYLYNPYREQNLAMSLQMKVLAEEYFPEFTRKNYIQAYQYNLHLRPKSMLIEAGAQTNSLQEVKNAMEPLAAILNMCIGNP